MHTAFGELRESVDEVLPVFQELGAQPQVVEDVSPDDVAQTGHQTGQQKEQQRFHLAQLPQGAGKSAQSFSDDVRALRLSGADGLFHPDQGEDGKQPPPHGNGQKRVADGGRRVVIVDAADQMNYGRFADDAVDRWVDRSRETFDPEARVEVVRKLELRK